MMLSNVLKESKVNFNRVLAIALTIVFVAIVSLVAMNPVRTYLNQNFWEQQFDSVSNDFTVEVSEDDNGSFLRLASDDYVSAELLNSVLNTYLDEREVNPTSFHNTDQFMVNFGDCGDGSRCWGFEFDSEDVTAEAITEVLSVYGMIESNESYSDFGVYFSTLSYESSKFPNSGQMVLVVNKFNLERWLKIVEIKQSLQVDSTLLIHTKDGSSDRLLLSTDENNTLNEETIRALGRLVETLPDRCSIGYGDVQGISARCDYQFNEPVDSNIDRNVEAIKTEFPNVSISMHGNYVRVNPQNVEQ